VEKVGLARQDDYSVLSAEFIINSPIAGRWRLEVFHTDTATIESLLVFASIVLVVWVSHSLIPIHRVAISHLFAGGGALRSRGMTVVHFSQGLKLFDSNTS